MSDASQSDPESHRPASSNDRREGGDGVPPGIQVTTGDGVRSDRPLDTLRAALGALEDFVYVLTPDARFTYANRALLDLWGLRLDDVIGNGFAELGYPPDLVALHRAQVAEVVATRQAVHGENAFVPPSGEEGYYEYIFSPVLGEGGGVEAVAGVTRDVTEWRRAADALRRSAEEAAFRDRLADALRPLSDPGDIQGAAARLVGDHFDANRAHYAEIEPDGGHALVVRDYERGAPNRAGRYRMADFATLDAETRAGRTFVVADVATDDRLSGDERAVYGALPLAALAVVPLVKEGRLRAVLAVHKSAPHAWTADQVALLEETAERTWAAVERARAEAALRVSERRYRRLFESMSEGFALGEVIWDDGGYPLDWRYLDVNPAWDQTGIPADEVVGRTVREIIPDIEPEWIETYGRVVRTGEPVTYEAYVAGLGKWFTTYAFKHSENRFGLLFLDVTERKEAEEDLAQERARLEAILDTLPVGLLIADAEGRIVRHNAAARELWGVPPETTSWEGYGDWMGWWPQSGERIRAEEWAMARALLHGEVTHGQLIENQKFGSEGRRYFLNNAAPVHDADGRITGGVVAMLDVTDRVGMEEELKELNERLEERVEERTAQVRGLTRALALAEQEERRRIAHLLHDDLQQRLHGLSIMLSLLRQSGPGESELLDRAEQALTTATALTRSLSHEMAPPLLRDDDLPALLAWLTDQARELHGLAVDVDVPRGLPALSESTRILLYRLLRELLFNVSKHSGTDRARVWAERCDGGVQIVVADEGAGFDVSTLDERTRGGLGLASVRERLEAVGGRLAVESAPGEGVRVTVEVPEGE